MKKVYILYEKNRFPNCSNEPGRFIKGVFTSKKKLDDILKEHRKKYSILNESDIEIEIGELDKLYGIEN